MKKLPSFPFDPADTLMTGYSILVHDIGAKLTGIAATAAGVFTKADHGFTKNTPLEFVSGTNSAPLEAGDIYYVIPVDEDTFKVSDSFDGEAIALTGAATAIVLQPVLIWEVPKLTHNLEQESKSLPRPQRNGRMYNARTASTKCFESWTAAIEDVLRLPDLFDGADAGSLDTNMRIYSSDISDGDNECAKISEKFACNIVRDGGMDVGGGDFSKASIKITSNKRGEVKWQRKVVLT